MNSNFGIPVAAITDLIGKPEEKINGRMTGALSIYSATFMRYAWSIYPLKGYLVLINSGDSSKLSSSRLSCY
jgi:mitochondrial pyruvate carrier 1